ncbi:MAG: TonB-dependent receptor [Acidobacteriota bacterium]|nr:TonB-dependent receptor [Acidobacteriota bacterium]
MKRFVVAVLTLCLFTSAAFAQSVTGQLTGSVSGPDGLIAGATVTITDDKTGKTLEVQTNDQGGFVFPQLEVGEYTVKVTAAGFKTLSAAQVKIDAARPYTLNPMLEVGGIEETVNVIAGADVINSTNAALSTTVSPRQVLDLPINGRNPLALLNLQAGVNPTSNSINGQRSSSANYTRDGINIQDNFIRTGGFVQDRPSVDDTGEFTVVTQNAGAEAGGGGSTQVQLVTPRGGSDFHGALFAYNRNSYFAANEFFSNTARTARPFLNRNQFGGKVGGPLALPRFGEGGPSLLRNKAFFFVSYERFLLRQQATVNRTVILPAARQGNFTYLDNAGVSRTINVLTGQGLLGPIPAAAGGVLSVDPLIQSRILDNIPTAGNGNLSNGGISQLLTLNQSDGDTRNGFTSRLDFDFNDRNSLNLVYKFNDNADERQTDGGGFGLKPFVTQGGPTSLYIATYRTTLSSRFVNETRGAYQRSEPFFNQGPVPSDFIIGGIPFASNPQATFRDQGRNTSLYVLQDNASFTFGNHAIRFGGQFEAHRIDAETNFDTIPTFSISTTGNLNTPRLAANLYPGGINATDRGRADALRYFLGGIIGSGVVSANFVDTSLGTVRGAPNIDRFKYDTYGFYLSDQWRITPRLTLNLGLRYDLFTGLKNPDVAYLEPVIPQGSNIRDALLNPAGVYNLIGTNTGDPGRFFNTDKNNFGPVVSFAWSPDFKSSFLGNVLGREGKTVIRGGFRISYINDEFIRSADNALGGNQGLDQTTTLLNLNRRASNVSIGIFPPISTISLPVSFRTRNLAPGQNFFNTVFAVDPDIQLQKNYEYNFGIQREIGFNTAIEIRYVGGRSNSLVRGFDFNQIDIFSTGFLADFVRAQNNCRLAAGGNLNNCTDARFNPAIAGSQPLPVFAQLPFGAFLNNSVITGQLINGTPADLALTYILNGLDIDANNVGVRFRPNPFAGVADLLTNGGKYRYDSLQAEIRRRFTNGFSLQANYTFQKILADVQSDGQARFDPFLDINNQDLDYARADYDRTHTINFNTIYELPFGSGKRWLNDSGWVDRIFGGFQFTSIVNISSGPPVGIIDPRGTLNRAARSGRQTAQTSLTPEQIKDLVGIFRTPNGVYLINPDVLFASARNATTGQTLTGINLREPLPTGFALTEVRGAAALNQPAFPGQVFFRNAPGQTGSFPRSFLNGPMYFNWDAGFMKRIRLTETSRLELRAEAFNVLNRANFFIADNSGIFNVNSTTFGQFGTTFSPRILQFAARLEF